jgi:hypothetical protein
MYQKQRTIYTQGFLLIESWREVVQLVTAIIKDYSRFRGRHKPVAVCQGYSTGELGKNGQSQNVIGLFFVSECYYSGLSIIILRPII